jgi:uncharacterized membrane protein (DUF485 family)
MVPRVVVRKAALLQWKLKWTLYTCFFFSMFGIDMYKVGFMNKPLQSNASVIIGLTVLTLKPTTSTFIVEEWYVIILP